MVSTSPLRIPLIDFSNLETHDSNDRCVWESVRTDVFNAFRDYGCFEVSSFISADLQESVSNALKELFDLPLETKVRNIGDIPFRGYSRSPKMPLYESTTIENLFVPEKVDNFTHLMWPHGNSKFRESIKTYSRKLHELDVMVKKMVFESLDLENYLDEQMQSTSYLLKMMKYRPPEPNESDIGLLTHTDTNIMTILHQHEIGGLEIQTKDDEWIQVEVSPNSFIVIAGETFNVWLNGRLHVPFHRVVMTGNKPRYSIGFFSEKSSSIVKTFDEMVDEEHPLLFKPFDYRGFLKFLHTGGGLKTKFALKSYCGTNLSGEVKS